jgi:hypothetical protein
MNPGPDLAKLLKQLDDEPTETEIIYAHKGLIEKLFQAQFGGITKFLESVAHGSKRALKGEAGLGVGGSFLKILLDIRAKIGAEKQISNELKVIIEKELTLLKKLRLCEAVLAEKGLIVENPPSIADTEGKYLKLVDRLRPFNHGAEADLGAALGRDAARTVLQRWREDQNATPNKPQIAYASAEPFPSAAIVMVRDDIDGSTYILNPPAPPEQRIVFAERERQEQGVTFLKTYWIVDVRPKR